jgi:hypothetical protein
MDKKIRISKYILVLFLTMVVFFSGLLVGNFISNIKLSNIDNMEQDIKVNTMAIEFQYDFLSENPCSSVNSTPLTEELYELGDKLSFMENTLGFDNPTVLRLKEYYSIVALRQWMFLKKTNEQCDMDNTLILYFYSNKGDCNLCEEQGYVLTYIRNKYPSVKVYAFDINIENIALKTIKSTYIKKNELPVLIIDEKTYYGFKNRKQIEEIIETIPDSSDK